MIVKTTSKPRIPTRDQIVVDGILELHEPGDTKYVFQVQMGSLSHLGRKIIFLDENNTQIVLMINKDQWVMTRDYRYSLPPEEEQAETTPDPVDPSMIFDVTEGCFLIWELSKQGWSPVYPSGDKDRNQEFFNKAILDTENYKWELVDGFSH